MATCSSGYDDLQPLSTKYLHLIKWIPDGETTTKRLKIAETLASKWRDVAKLTGLNHSQIATIENAGSGKTPEQCLDDVLEKWQETHGGARADDYPYNWDGLVEVLADAEFRVFADDLKEALSSHSSSIRGNLNPQISTVTHINQQTSVPSLMAKEQTELLESCTLNIYELLDIDKIYPNLCQQGLLNDMEKKHFNKCENSRERKITIVLTALPQKGPDAVTRFVRCLKETQADPDHKHLADIIENPFSHAGQSNKGYSISRLLILIAVPLTMLALLLIYIYYPGFYNIFNHYQSTSLPFPSKIFVGREQEMSDLMSHLDFRSESDIRILNIVGSPGFGKSTLAIHVGDRLVKQGVVVHYVSLAEYQEQNVHLTLAEKIHKAADLSSKVVTFEALLKWLRKRFWNTLIILDDCDDILQNEKEPFFNALKQMVEQTTRLKILITSREITTQLEYFKRYPVYELSTRAACELLARKMPSGTNLTNIEIEEVAKLTGNVPLAVQIIGALLTSPSPPSPSVVIKELHQRPIPFLSDEKIPDSHKVNITIYLSYRYLSSDMQKIGRYLAYFPGSFHKDAAIVIHDGLSHKSFDDFNDYTHYLQLLDRKILTDTLDSLLHRSLIEFDIRTQRYQFHRLIREFFREIQIISGERGQSELKRFNTNFHLYYSMSLAKYAHLFQENYKEALSILRVERHNFLKILEDLESNNFSASSFFLMVRALSISIDRSALRSIFSDEDIVHPLQSALTEYFDRVMNSRAKHELLDAEPVYVHLVSKLSVIENKLYGPRKAMETCQQRTAVIDSFNISAINVLYQNFYFLLGEYQAALRNYAEASACYGKMMSLKWENFASECMEGSTRKCSYLKMGTAMNDFSMHKEAATFLNASYNLEEHSKMEKLKLLFFAVKVNNILNNQDEVETFSQELYELVQDIGTSLNLELFTNKDMILQMVTALIKLDKVEIATALEAKLLEAVLDIGATSSVDSIGSTWEIVVYYYKERNYNRVVQLATFLMNSQTLSTEDLNSSCLRIKWIIAKARYDSGNYSEGMDEMEIILNLIFERGWETEFRTEFSHACYILIPRMKYLYACYATKFFELSIYPAKLFLYSIFVIPLEPYTSYESNPVPLPQSVFPELQQLSSSKEVLHTTQNYTMLDSIDMHSSISGIVWSYRSWLYDNVASTVSFILRYTVIRFLLNVISIVLRIYLILFIALIYTVLVWLIYAVIVQIFILSMFYLLFVHYRFFLYPKTLAMLRMIVFTDQLIKMSFFNLSCLIIFSLSGINVALYI